MRNAFNACLWSRAGSRSPFLAASIIRFAIISRAVINDPKRWSDTQARSKASPIADVAASSNESYCIELPVIVTSRMNERGARQRLSVTVARSYFGDEARLAASSGRWLVHTDHFSFFSRLIGSATHWKFTRTAGIHTIVNHPGSIEDTRMSSLSCV